MSGLIVACFVVSGATSLVLQVVWVRKLTEVFGSSTLAISTVLATFMAGLALGAWLGGRLADRLPREPAEVGRWRRLLGLPLFYYAVCEGLVAIAALAVPSLVASYRPLNATLWAYLGDYPLVLAAARFALTAVVLMIPTTAMGATLPLLGRQVTRHKSDLEHLARRLGVLYAANTTGAVLGAAAAGFVLLPALGAHATNVVAASLAGSLAISIIIALAAAKGRTGSLEVEMVMQSDYTPPPLPAKAERRLALAAYGLSGATAMALEVLWSRALAVVIGSSVYSFTLILVVFLIGISLGSALLARKAQRTIDVFRTLSITFAVTGVSIALTHLIVDDLPSVFLGMVSGSEMTPGSILTIHSILVGLIILPAALGLGAIMPLAMRAYVGGVEAVGRDVGRAYAANTVGAIVGSIAGGIVLLPLLGIERGVLLCALLYAGGAALLATRTKARKLPLALATAIIVMMVLAPRWNRSDFTAGLFRTHIARHYLGEGGLVKRNVAYYADGIATTVSVEQSKSQWTLKNNGKTEASNKTDMPTQILVGLLPSLLHSRSEQDVFVIGYGSGVTIGAITQSPEVRRIDVVELEPKVLEAADRYFSAYNNEAHTDPKVHRYIGDGRDVLLAGQRSYDIIVSEPSNPWMAGVSSLFTREFYRFAKNHLSEDGIFCQWAQLYELGTRNVKMIYATFAEAFPYVYAFTPGDRTSDTILIGSLKPLRFDLYLLDKKMKDPTLRAELLRANIENPEELLASFFLGPADLGPFTAGSEINTDDNALLEYAAPMDLLSESRARLALEIRHAGWPYGRMADIVTGLDSTRAIRLAAKLVGYGRYREARHWLDFAEDASENASSGTAWQQTMRLVELAEPTEPLDPELPVTAGGDVLAPPTAALFAGSRQQAKDAVRRVLTAYRHLAEGEWTSAWNAISDLPPRADGDAAVDIDLVRAYLAYKAGRLLVARKILRRIATDESIRRRPATLYYQARVHFGLGSFARGTESMSRFIDDFPDLARQVAESRL